MCERGKETSNRGIIQRYRHRKRGEGQVRERENRLIV